MSPCQEFQGKNRSTHLALDSLTNPPSNQKVLTMVSALFLLFLATLAQSSPHQKSFLPEGCQDFTVGQCNPEQDELIDSYPEIPDMETCQIVCGIQEGCNFFRHSKSTLDCQLYHYRFLTSCNLIAGPMTPTIDECSKDEEHSCDSFIRENCLYMGTKVLEKDSITDQHACQDLLLTVGAIYHATYFTFDSNAQVCVLYDTADMDCDAISGPVEPLLETCGNPPTSAPTDGPTTAAPTAPATTGAP